MRYSFYAIIVGLVIASSSPIPVQAQGIIFPGVGPVNRSMGGVSTATAVDPIGANYWNPAAIRSLPSNAIGFGSEFIIGDTHLSSTIQGGAVNGFPPTTRSGNTRSDGGLSSAPSIGLVWHPEMFSKLSVGLGITTPAIGAVNFPGDASNPVLSPNNPPNSFGLGPVAASMALFGSSLNVAYEVTDKLTVGVGGTVTSTLASMDPAFFGGRNDANGDGVSNFSPATHSHPFWGGGFQLGAVYHLNQDWDFGFGYKSTLWQEEWTFRSYDELLRAKNVRLKINFPNVYSWGVAYKGLERTLLAADIRYIDYANTALFGQRVIDGGLGWKSIFSLALGGQHQLTEKVTLRAGYIYSQNPISDPATLFNIQLPGITQHTISGGLSYEVNDNIQLNLAYVHGFESQIEGTILQVPGTSVALNTEYDSIVVGLTIKFGGARRQCQDCVSSMPVETSTSDWAHQPITEYGPNSFIPSQTQN